MTQGHLHVTIIEAAKFKDKEKHDFNDTYVEVYIDEKNKQKTKTINKVIQTGRFDDWIQLPGLLGFGSRSDIHIRVTYEQT